MRKDQERVEEVIKFQRLFTLFMLLPVTAPTVLAHADDDDETENSCSSLRVAPTSVSLACGTSAAVQVSGARGTVSVATSDAARATVRYRNASSFGGVTIINGRAGGTATITVRDSRSLVRVAVKVAASTGGGGGTPPQVTPPPTLSGLYTLLAANDLGMHCADQDYQIFSILRPFNVVHAQVVQRGTGSAMPKVLAATEAVLPVAFRSRRLGVPCGRQPGVDAERAARHPPGERRALDFQPRIRGGEQQGRLPCSPRQ